MTEIICNGEISISALLKAKAMLDNAIAVAGSPLEKTGAIQCFEYSYELAWKTMKRILAYNGIETSSPRDAFREAARIKLITDPEVWFIFIKKRNMTSHTYNFDLAEEVFDFLPEFQAELSQFIQYIQTL